MLCLRAVNYQLKNSKCNTTLLFETLSLEPKIIAKSAGTMTQKKIQTFFEDYVGNWKAKEVAERERERERERDKLFRKPKNIICQNWKNKRCMISSIVKPQNFHMANYIYI